MREGINEGGRRLEKFDALDEAQMRDVTAEGNLNPSEFRNFSEFE